jgi:hypothetical protein
MFFVRFVADDEVLTEYGWGDAALPRPGDGLVSDGSDPQFRPGIWEVTYVTHHVALRGRSLVVIDLRWVYENPSAVTPELHEEQR